MIKNDFMKVGGAEGRQDLVMRLSRSNWLLIYGYGEDETGGWNWRKYYDHKPTKMELESDIHEVIDKTTTERITSGMQWNGVNVWLSVENQMNFKAAHDLAVETEGKSLPVKFKIGEDENGAPVYHEFVDLQDLVGFWDECVAHILGCLEDGWKEKDELDVTSLFGNE